MDTLEKRIEQYLKNNGTTGFSVLNRKFKVGFNRLMFTIRKMQEQGDVLLREHGVGYRVRLTDSRYRKMAAGGREKGERRC